MYLARWREPLLLCVVAAILGLGYWVVWQAYMPAWLLLYHGQLWRFFAPWVLFTLGGFLTSMALSARRCRETLMLPIVALLVGLGLLFLQRLAGGAATLAMQQGVDIAHLTSMHGHVPPIASIAKLLISSSHKQILSASLAWLVLVGIILYWHNLSVLSRYKYLIAFTALGLLLVTTIFGHAVGHQQLALNLGFVTFQPHDPVKLLLVIFMAAYLEEKQELISFARGRFGFLTMKDFRYMGPLITLWVVIMAIVFIHNDLGAALLLFGTLLVMLYLGTERKVYVGIGLGLFILGALAAFAVSHRVQTRVAIWENPWKYADDESYQIVQGLMALGNGRLIGAGLAGGSPERIPAIHTDLIYVAIGEDLGLVGAVCVILLFLILIGRTVVIALRARDRFGQLLAAGLGLTLAGQTWIILAGVTKLIPLTGITLPFISYGGTSMMVNLILVGLVLKTAEDQTPAVSDREMTALHKSSL